MTQNLTSIISAIVQGGEGALYVSEDGEATALIRKLDERPGGYIVVWERTQLHVGDITASHTAECPIKTVALWIAVNRASVREI